MEQSTFRETCGLAYRETEVYVRVEPVRKVAVRSREERGNDKAHSCSTPAPASRGALLRVRREQRRSSQITRNSRNLVAGRVFDKNIVSCWGPVHIEVTGDLTLRTVTFVQVPPVRWPVLPRSKGELGGPPGGAVGHARAQGCGSCHRKPSGISAGCDPDNGCVGAGWKPHRRKLLE